MELRCVSTWEKVFKEAINASAAEQVSAEHGLLQLGIPATHWLELEVRAKLERGEWVIFNVNVLRIHQHFVLLKSKLKSLRRRNGHIVCASKSNGLCVFTAALQIAKAGSALDPMGAAMSDPGVGELARQEFRYIRKRRTIEGSKQFATLLQTAALHEQIAAHMYRSEKAAQRKASRDTSEGCKSRRSDERSA